MATAPLISHSSRSSSGPIAAQWLPPSHAGIHPAYRVRYLHATCNPLDGLVQTLFTTEVRKSGPSRFGPAGTPRQISSKSISRTVEKCAACSRLVCDRGRIVPPKPPLSAAVNGRSGTPRTNALSPGRQLRGEEVEKTTRKGGCIRAGGRSGLLSVLSRKEVLL